MANLKQAVFTSLNALLGRFHMRLLRHYGEFDDFIPFEKTLAAAAAHNMSVSDYIDAVYNQPGATQATIDQLRELGVFQRPIWRVCEIGPGSGRYLTRVIEECRPEYYEIYETSPKWRDWLVKENSVVAQPTDGVSLSATPDGSIDLVHAHKVLNGLKILNIFAYFYEIARVAAPRATLVFDVLTEDCLDEDTVRGWLDSGADYVTSMTCRQLVVDFFTRRGFTLTGSFIASSRPGVTHYFVFTRG